MTRACLIADLEELKRLSVINVETTVLETKMFFLDTQCFLRAGMFFSGQLSFYRGIYAGIKT